ncbi:DUF2971 domain-containing protein [Aeromicrobium alkaliterrae]|uniref:DUF2971 domain-containing protein n=1 Tax=Aeromicrobium alkaliterrae TaxID=302168 RepID=A0ABP4VZ70_9ACTN
MYTSPDDLENTGDEALENLVAEVERVAPSLVWHYTDQSGLIGILRSGAIWATDAMFLNDRHELSHGKNRLRAALEDEVDGADFAGLSLYLERGWRHNVRTAVSCFCADGDLLSQWRGYSSPGGFAIGFDTNDLARRWIAGRAGLFLPVVYARDDDQGTFREWAQRVANAWREALGGGLQTAVGGRNPVADSLAAEIGSKIWRFDREVGNLDALAARFKDPSFSEEQEWRLITMIGNESSEADVRPSAGGLVPFRSVPFQGSSADSPVREIRVGPGLDFEREQLAVQQLLDIVGYSNVTISGSTVPFRP